MNIQIKHKAELNPLIENVLVNVEANSGGVLIVTDDARTIQEHIEIYKKIYGIKWIEKIKWRSYHLSKWFNIYCNAVDFKIEVNNNFLAGTEIAALIEKACKEFGIKETRYGLGIGLEFIHFDIREDWQGNPARWEYTY